VATFIADTLIESLPVLFHYPAGRFVRNGRNFLGYRLLKTFQGLGTMLVSFVCLFVCLFEVASEEKSHMVKYGKRGGHPMSPLKETRCPGNISLGIPSERRDVWAVAPSC
jgi:hypothetical protein